MREVQPQRVVPVPNDFYAPNFLVSGNDMYLIDWEYSAMSDYASDLGTFICCSDYTYEEACRVFDEYFGRQTTPEELRHCLAYVALASYYWFVRALYKESSGARWANGCTCGTATRSNTRHWRLSVTERRDATSASLDKGNIATGS